MDSLDVFRLLIGSGLSAAIFMGFWVLWLKTKNPGFRIFAFAIGPLPAGFVVLVILGRLIFASGVIHEFTTGAAGPGMRELSFPVEDAEIRHILEISPVISKVSVKNPDGELLETTQTVNEGKLQVEFEARRGGSHRVLLENPEGVGAVKVVAREWR
ncbi:MAG: hypothetical protein NTW74_16495 [Acidobacteria bacterium]|nr:hypothetical protein [Acidobacteriota bacterium]